MLTLSLSFEYSLLRLFWEKLQSKSRTLHPVDTSPYYLESLTIPLYRDRPIQSAIYMVVLSSMTLVQVPSGSSPMAGSCSSPTGWRFHSSGAAVNRKYVSYLTLVDVIHRYWQFADNGYFLAIYKTFKRCWKNQWEMAYIVHTTEHVFVWGFFGKQMTFFVSKWKTYK